MNKNMHLCRNKKKKKKKKINEMSLLLDFDKSFGTYEKVSFKKNFQLKILARTHPPTPLIYQFIQLMK